MQKVFLASLCREGIRGGAVIINEKAVIYKTKNLTISDQYKNITMPLGEIEKVGKGYAFVFPAVTIELKSQQKYKFVIVNRRRFLQELQRLGFGIQQ